MTRLERLSQRLTKAETEAQKYAEVELTQDRFNALCSFCASQCLPKNGKISPEQATALQQSLNHLKNKTLKKDTIYLNMYRVFANWHFIREGMHIPVWQGEPDTADIIFIGVKVINTEGLPKYKVAVRLKTGLGAGLRKTAIISSRALQLFLDRYSGCGKFECPVEEVAGMQARALVSHPITGLRIHSWECTQENKKHNRQLAEIRGDLTKCQRRRTCNTCAKTIKECPLAVWLADEEEYD